jgi:hypothetical protein
VTPGRPNAVPDAPPSDAAPGWASRTVHVAYIGGSGRSGSTLLDLILGQIDGFCAVGELVHLWERGVVGNQLCGCGARFRTCAFWVEVGEEAFGGWDGVDAREVMGLARRVKRHRFIPLMVAPALSVSFRHAASAYGDVQRRLYRAIRRVSGCRVVVDSSKEVPHALLLSRLEDVRISVVHLVRDSRGVAYSWRKRVVRPEVANVPTFMPRHHPVRSAVEWMLDNLLLESLVGRGSPHRLVRYEALIEDPRRWVSEIVRFLGGTGSDEDLEFIGDEHVELRPTHSVSGNPMRFRAGRVPVRLDEAWRVDMSPKDRAVVTLLTRPLLARYGYR